MPLQLLEGEDNDCIRLSQSWKHRWCEVILMGRHILTHIATIFAIVLIGYIFKYFKKHIILI